MLQKGHSGAFQGNLKPWFAFVFFFSLHWSVSPIQLGRTALELMAARARRVPPYVSLDFAWCAGHDGTLNVAHRSAQGGSSGGAGSGEGARGGAAEKRKLVC